MRICAMGDLLYHRELWRLSLPPSFSSKRIYNSIIMIYFNYILLSEDNTTPGVVTLDLSWASDVLALLGIIGAIATVAAILIRHEVKKNFNEIKAEFKPNGGSSLKDQVNRLESRHGELDAKVDKLDGKVDTIVNFILKTKDTE
jgi:hypothetical protein